MYSFGRIESHDVRDTQYSIAPLLFYAPNITEKFWWDDGWWGDQGDDPFCVAFSWMHWLEDGPVIQDSILGRQKPLFDVYTFYKTCQKIDGFDGDNYAGTTVRAGAKILKKLGLITEYRWGFSIDEIIISLLTLGPMVIGTKWTDRMNIPNNKGLIKSKGRIIGGHAYIINGIDVNREYFRIKNSWGYDWGDKGHAYISFSDFEKLFNDEGEACIASEIKIREIPSLGWIKK
jgi:hypothetical protein